MFFFSVPSEFSHNGHYSSAGVKSLGRRGRQLPQLPEKSSSIGQGWQFTISINPRDQAYAMSHPKPMNLFQYFIYTRCRHSSIHSLSHLLSKITHVNLSVLHSTHTISHTFNPIFMKTMSTVNLKKTQVSHSTFCSFPEYYHLLLKNIKEM